MPPLAADSRGFCRAQRTRRVPSSGWECARLCRVCSSHCVWPAAKSGARLPEAGPFPPGGETFFGRTKFVMAIARSLIFFALFLFCLGCDQVASPSASQLSEQQRAAAAEKAAGEKHKAEQLRKQQQLAAEEAEKAEKERLAAQESARKEARAACCAAMAKAGFEQRSAALSTAARACEALAEEQKEWGEMRLQLAEQLGEIPLPSICPPQ